MTSFTPQQIAEAFVALASINDRVNKHAVASLTWIAYDIIICMGQEVELIWKTRWTIPKVLYIVLRYYGVLWLMYQCIVHITPGSQLSKLTCESFPALQAVGLLSLWILVDMILLLRIRALYQSKKSIVYLSYSAFIVAACVVIPVIIYCFRLSRPVPAPFFFSRVAGCLVLDVDLKKMSTVKVAVAAFILLNILYLSLSLYQFVQSIKALKRIRFGSMFAILVGDGVLYFIGCVALNAVDMLFTGNIPLLFPYVDVLQFCLGAFYSYAGCHLILHLRSANNSLTSLTTFMDCADMDVRYFEPSTDDEGVDLGEIKSRV